VNIVTKNFQEKRRKGETIELEKCKLLEMMQYSCNPPEDGVPPPGVVICKPVVRLFRRYVRFEAGLISDTECADFSSDVRVA
jgi:hypothetical protein